MKQCEKCISLNRYPAPDAEVIGCPVNDAPTCLVYPEGIPDELLTDQKPCQFYIDEKTA